MRGYEGREDVVAAVAGAAVAVLPAVVGGEEGVQGGEEVVVTAYACLEDRDARRGVRDEEVEEAVAATAASLRNASQSRVRSMTRSLEPVVTFRTRVVKAADMSPSWPMRRTRRPLRAARSVIRRVQSARHR